MQAIIFSYWHENKLQGFIADEFGTITQHKPLLFFNSDVDTERMIQIVTYAASNRFSSMSKRAFAGKMINQDQYEKMFTSTCRTQKTIRAWKRFEVKAHLFDTEMLAEMELQNLQKEIEVYKFKIVENEN